MVNNLDGYPLTFFRAVILFNQATHKEVHVGGCNILFEFEFL